MNFIKSLYGDVKREDLIELDVSYRDVNWDKLSGTFATRITLYGKDPVGEVLSNGFKFKLNYLNYFPIVPAVTISLDGTKLRIFRQYDWLSRILQYYWMSIFVIGISVFTIGPVWDFLSPPPDYTLDLIFGPIIFNIAWIGILVIFHKIRKNLWKDSLKMAQDLLERLDIHI